MTIRCITCGGINCNIPPEKLSISNFIPALWNRYINVGGKSCGIMMKVETDFIGTRSSGDSNLHV